MASISTSNYHKYVELQNVSASGDPASAPEGGVYLFASGSSAAPNTARLYMQNEGGTVTDLSKTLDIDAFDALGGAGLHQTQDYFVFSDNGTEKKITFSNLQDAVFADVSGDATVAAGGALTIANDAVEQAMIADDAVGADQLAANAVVNASIASNAAIDMDKLDGGSLASSLSDLAQTDLLYAGDVDDSSNLKKITFSDFEDAIFGNVSGDATIAAGGALTIANDAVEQAMVADDAVGADQLAANAVVNASVVDGAIKADKLDLDGSTDIGADLVDADLMIVDDGAAGTNRVAALSRIKKYIYSAMSGDAAATDAGALTIAANAVEGSMLNSNTAGDGLGYASNALKVQVSGAVAITSDKVAISGSIAGAGLAYSGAVGAIGGLSLDIDNLDAGSSLHQTQDHFAFSDNGTEKKITFSDLEDAIFGNVSGDATIAAGGALTIANDAVEQAMIADDAVGADQLASNAVVNASVASNAAIAGTKLDFNVDFGGNVNFGSQSDDSVIFGGSIALGGNAIANSQGEATITLDVDQNASIAAGLTVTSGLTVGGGYGSSGVSVSAAGAISADGALTIGADGAGVNFKAFGGAANEHMTYDAGNHVLTFVNGSGATMLNLGGDATTEYALDVANGSDNINKVRAAAFVTYSDESLKSDVATMNTALDTVMSLNGVEFTWNDSGERDFGFIAQEVQNVLPRAVHTAADGVQGVDYSRLTSVLVEAVKAQQVQIEELKAILKK
tara:strand:+ start:1128 stop:3335 length:2208 start_codon:yes stop_codon:yes gene_type:complete